MGEKFIVYNGDNKIGVLYEDGYIRDPNHKYLIWDKNALPGFVSQAALILTQQYFNEERTLKKWREDEKLYNINTIKYGSTEKILSKPINYKIIAQHLREYGLFNDKEFELPQIFSNWLDRTLDASVNFHFTDKNGDVLKIKDGTLPEEYGDTFPINPVLDREGHIFTTFHPQLIKRVIKQRKHLVENSHLALTHEWIFELRNVINDSISLIDITLNQLYNKAEFAPEQGWKFDKLKLGPKNNRRIKDKLRWVREISGKELNIELEYKKFDNLREIRNHFNHFDPPTLVITLEEATDWLNDVLYIGQILIKIRQAVGTSISTSLVEYVVQKQVLFNPEPAFANRTPLDHDTAGYKSSIWKNTETE